MASLRKGASKQVKRRFPMKNRFFAATVVLAIVIALVPWASIPAVAQAPKASAKPWNPPRTANGQLDL